MSRHIRLLAAAFACITGSVLAPRPALAGQGTPIYNAANEYREAVRVFEQQVLRTPKIRSSVERLVDHLEDSTSRLKTAARDPARFDRLTERFIATDKLHAQVQLTFFGDPLFPPGLELESCWIAVDQAYGILTYEIRYLQQIRNAKRGQYLPIIDHSYAGPAFGAPSYGAPARYVAPQSRVDSNALYGSEYTRTFRAETYGPRPALGGVASGPALNPQSFRPALSAPSEPALRGPSALPRGAQLQRPAPSVAPARRTISTRDELRSAVIGAMLQRQ